MCVCIVMPIYGHKTYVVNNPARHGVAYDDRNRSRANDLPTAFDETKFLRSLCTETTEHRLHNFFSTGHDFYAALVGVDTRLTQQANDLRKGARRLLHILRRSDRMGTTMCDRFYIGATNDVARRWHERDMSKRLWQGSLLLASGVFFNRNCGVELSPEGLVRAGFMDELSEYPPAWGSNIEIANSQSNDGRIHQNRSSTVLGLSSFDSQATADEIMRISSERGLNAALIACGSTINKSKERGSGLPAVVNSILLGDSCDIYVKCGVDS